jgi:hypothetical protein
VGEVKSDPRTARFFPRCSHHLVALPLSLLPGGQTLAATSRRCRHPPSHVAVLSPLPCAIAASPLFPLLPPPPLPCCRIAVSSPRRLVAPSPCRHVTVPSPSPPLLCCRLAVSSCRRLAMSSCRRLAVLSPRHCCHVACPRCCSTCYHSPPACFPLCV